MRRAAFLLLLAALTGCATANVNQILGAHPDKSIAVAFYDLRDGRTFFRNEHEVFHAASTMKVPVMLGIFDAVARGALRLDQPVRVKNEFTSIYDGSRFAVDPKEDSDATVYQLVGTEVRLELLVRRMIVRSSNLATNNVIELVGAKRVMELMHGIGANEIEVLRGVEDQKAYDHGMNNTVTAYDLMLVFRALMNAPGSQKMIDILSAQEFNSGIPAGLPPGTRVAHKTGEITRIAHDAGIVFRPDGSAYILVVLTRGFDRAAEANEVIARISNAIWRETLTPRATLAARMGYPRDAKLLIVHADHLGMAHSIDAASTAALQTGLVTSASIMVPCPSFSEVAAFARTHPLADLGVHLTLTSEWTSSRWGPISDRATVRSLLDAGGAFYRTESEAAAIDRQEAETEIRAQIARARAAGIEPTHIDSHMGVLYQNRALFDLLLRVARDEKIPARISRAQLAEPFRAALVQPGDVVIERVISIGANVPAEKWNEWYTNEIRKIEPGVTEIVVHLAYDDAEMQAMTADHPNWGAAWRQRDYDFFTGEQFQNLLRENDIHRITWREVGKVLR